MKILCQRDPLWAKETIGKSGLTIGRYGCTITSLSMLSSQWGPYITPPVLAKKLTFTKQGLIIWQSIEKVMGFKFIWRGYSAPKTSELPLLLEVDHCHWVVGVGLDKGIYKILDPWDGKEALSTRYDNITGYASFLPQKQSIPEPSWIGKLKIPVPTWIKSKK